MFRSLRRRLRDRRAARLEADLSAPPAHLAVIPDGNRRHARARNAPIETGHRAGAETAEALLEWCIEFEVAELTIYGFSTENFERPPDERAAILDLIAAKLDELAESDRVERHGVRVTVFGDRARLPAHVRSAAETVEAATAEHDGLRCNVGLAYGGRVALLEGVRDTLEAVERGTLDPTGIDGRTLDATVGAVSDRPVDLLVRTGGEYRTSNFLPWRARGAEATMVSVERHWPSFDRAALLEAFRTHERIRAGIAERRRARRRASRELARAADASTEPAVSSREAERERPAHDRREDSRGAEWPYPRDPGRPGPSRTHPAPSDP